MKILSIYTLLLLFGVTTLYAWQFSSRQDDATQLAARSLRSGNAVIAVQVNDTLGSSLLNPFKGLFNIGTADNKPLLATFPQEQYFSHFNVRIDGTVYSNNPNRTGAQLLPLLSAPRLLPDGTITCSYQISGITIEQRLQPEQYSPTTGAILIKYLITNTGAAAHQVGLLLLLDTFVGGTDNARVATRFDYSRIERQYAAPLIPDYFQAFESDNPIFPGLIAQGTLVGREAVRPDLAIIGDVFTLRTVQWDYTIQNPFYNDSAVILRWNEAPLAPNASREIATYYGRGEAAVKTGALALNLTAPNRLEAAAGQLTPNPFEINLIVFNTGAAAATAVQATLTLPPGLALASGELATKPLSPADLNVAQIGTVSWKVLAQCPAADDSLSFRVDVKATNAPPNFVARNIFVPSCAAFKLRIAPPALTIVAGQTADYAVSVQPSGGFTGSVGLTLLPATPPPGITATFSPPRISANTTSTLRFQTDPALLPGNYHFVITGESAGLNRSEMITLNVQAAPPVDKSPPFTTNHNPARGARNVPLDSDIIVEVDDGPAGVDRNTLGMNVVGIAGAIEVTEIRSLPKAYRLRFRPAAPFRDNQIVQVRVNAGDLAVPPNLMPEDNYTFMTVRDSLPPFIVNHSPAPRATGVSPNTAIAFELRDDLRGVDSAAVVMRVNRNLVRPNLQRLPNGFLISYKPSASFALNDTIRLSIEARDRATAPNVMPVENFYFVTQRDVIPPLATNHRPANGATNVPLDTDIRVEVIDELAGVDRNALAMQVNGQLVQATVTPILQGFLLQYQPAQHFRYNANVQVVIHARDLAQPANAMSPDTLRFATIRDIEPPFATDPQPAPGATSAAANTNIVLHVRDLIAGVEHASLVMTLNGSVVSPVISGNPQNYKLEYDPPQDFAPGDTMRVSIAAQDLSFPPNVMARENYSFIIQQQLPDLAVTSLRPQGMLFVGLPGMVIGEILNAGSVAANRAFNLQFRVDGGTQKDTTFSQFASGERVTLRLPIRFQTTGTHEVELAIDVGDNVREITENNNSQKLVIQIAPSAASASRLIVRPNPFTPNNDGFNDRVDFDYTGLNLRNPSLQIFDANGIAIWSNDNPSAGHFTWNGHDDRGHDVVPGVYLYTVRDQGNNVASGYVVVAR